MKEKQILRNLRELMNQLIHLLLQKLLKVLALGEDNIFIAPCVLNEGGEEVKTLNN